MTSLTAILASTEGTYLPGRTITKPLSHFTTDAPDLVALVADAAQRFDGSGVLLLDARAAARLGLPWQTSELPSEPKTHPAELALRGAGWNMSKLQAWTVLHAPSRPTVNLCLLDLVNGDPSATPVIMRSHVDTVTALDIWHRNTGTAWFGSAGTASTSLMRSVARTKGGARKGKEPTWLLTSGDSEVPAFIGDTECNDYKIPQWRGKPPAKTDRWIIGYDLNRMYLAAAGVARLAPFRLRHTGKQPYMKDIAGMWRVKLSPWPKDAKHKVLPCPFGYTIDNEAERWLSGPTLDLLDQLTAEGFYKGYEVLDSWTCRDAHEILKPWSQALNTAYMGMVPSPGEAEVDAARAAFKEAYKRGLGMLSKEESRVYRPDWGLAVKEQARANLWRKIRATGTATGRWPMEIAVDCPFYPAATDDAKAEAPTFVNSKDRTDGVVLGEALGQFNIDKIRAIPGRGDKEA